MKEDIIQLTKDKIADFQKYFYKVKEWQEKEDIHQLRLTIKNLRVILSILDLATNKGFNKRSHLKIFSPLFKSAGRLREAQINMKLMHKLEDKNSRKYLKYLKKKESQQLKRLIRELKKFNLKKFRKLNKKLIGKSEKMKDKQLKKTIHKYLHKNLSRIQKVKKNIKGNRDLHDIRIHLKRVEEVMVLLQIINPAKENRKELKSVRAMRNKIGKWHDYIACSSAIKEYLDETKTRSDKKLGKRLHLETRRIMDKRRVNIEERLKAFKIKI